MFVHEMLLVRFGVRYLTLAYLTYDGESRGGCLLVVLQTVSCLLLHLLGLCLLLLLRLNFLLSTGHFVREQNNGEQYRTKETNNCKARNWLLVRLKLLRIAQ